MFITVNIVEVFVVTVFTLMLLFSVESFDFPNGEPPCFACLLFCSIFLFYYTSPCSHFPLFCVVFISHIREIRMWQICMGLIMCRMILLLFGDNWNVVCSFLTMGCQSFKCFLFSLEYLLLLAVVLALTVLYMFFKAMVGVLFGLVDLLVAGFFFVCWLSCLISTYGGVGTFLRFSRVFVFLNLLLLFMIFVVIFVSVQASKRF